MSVTKFIKIFFLTSLLSSPSFAESTTVGCWYKLIGYSVKSSNRGISKFNVKMKEADAKTSPDGCLTSAIKDANKAYPVVDSQRFSSSTTTRKPYLINIEITPTSDEISAENLNDKTIEMLKEDRCLILTTDGFEKGWGNNYLGKIVRREIKGC